MQSSNRAILVVDDDEEVSDLLVIVLQRAGYYVLNALTGEDALELCRRCTGTFDFAEGLMAFDELNDLFRGLHTSARPKPGP